MTSKPAAVELGHELTGGVLHLVVVVHQLGRTEAPHRPVGRVEAEPPAGRQHPEGLSHDGVAVGLAHVLNRLPAVDEVERAVLVAAQVDHGVEGELHRPELALYGRAGRPAPVDLMALVDGEVDHDEALEGIGVAEVHQGTVGKTLMGAAQVEDA